jgi:hypothetical protein
MWMVRLLGSTAVALAAASALAWVVATDAAQANSSSSARGPPTLDCGAMPARKVVRIEAERVRCPKARAVAQAHQRSRARGGSCATARRGCMVAGFRCTEWPAPEGNTRILCITGPRKVTFQYRGAAASALDGPAKR